MRGLLGCMRLVFIMVCDQGGLKKGKICWVSGQGGVCWGGLPVRGGIRGVMEESAVCWGEQPVWSLLWQQGATSLQVIKDTVSSPGHLCNSLKHYGCCSLV